MGQGHGHGHGQAHSGGRHFKRLAVAFALTLGYFLVEATFAVITGSLLLLADAGHMLTDTVGLGLALAAITVAARGSRNSQRSYGLYRLEVLAALANSALLFALAGYIIWQAVIRLDEPVNLPTGQLVVVALIGLAVNFTCFLLLREGAKDNLNMRGAYLEVVADAIGSVAVIVAAVLIVATGWSWVDPAFALALGAYILPRTTRLGAQALRVLLQAAPAHVDLAAVAADLCTVQGVTGVRDLHVWTLTSQMEVATAHLQIADGAEHREVLEQAQDVLRERWRLAHSTVQIEPDGHHGGAVFDWCGSRDRASRPPESRAAQPALPLRGRHRRG
ncbi:MAG: cation diffusion facilitator family transporter [Sporichthyaceae bacterium]